MIEKYEVSHCMSCGASINITWKQWREMKLSDLEDIMICCDKPHYHYFDVLYSVVIREEIEDKLKSKLILSKQLEELVPKLENIEIDIAPILEEEDKESLEEAINVLDSIVIKLRSI